MFDIGATELLVIAIVAIIVVGPKELPRMLRTVGQVVGKARSMAREFQSHLNDAADEAGLEEVRKGIASVKETASGNDFTDAFKPLAETGEDIKRELEKTETASIDTSGDVTDPIVTDGTGSDGGPVDMTDNPVADKPKVDGPKTGKVASDGEPSKASAS